MTTRTFEDWIAYDTGAETYEEWVERMTESEEMMKMRGHLADQLANMRPSADGLAQLQNAYTPQAAYMQGLPHGQLFPSMFGAFGGIGGALAGRIGK